jgi:O-antigen/teichoic acid export membrane protein
VKSPHPCKHAARRNRSIKLAVGTSFLSKGGNALLQLLALPIAIRVLGREEFGLFTSVTFILSTIWLLEVGIGPALAHGISKANAQGDDQRRSELASTAFFMMAAVALVAGLLLAVVLLAIPLPTIFGDAYRGKEDAMRPALWVGLWVFLLVIVLNLVDRLREGQLEVAQTNLWGAVGNLLAAVAVGVGVFIVPEIWFLVLAIHGTQVLAKGANMIGLWRRHSVLIPRLRNVRRSVARHIFGDGVAFAVVCLLAPLVEYNLCGWMVGRFGGGPHQVALFGVFVSLSVMQLGLVVMFTNPTWPAVAESLARGHRAWAAQAARRLQMFGVAIAVCSVVGLVALGPWVFEIWLGEEFADTGRGVFACFAVFFAAHVWRHVNHWLMIGTGQVMRLARIQLIETLVLAVAAWFALRTGGLGAMLIAMGATITLFTGLLLPRRVAAVLKEDAGEIGEPLLSGGGA